MIKYASKHKWEYNLFWKIKKKKHEETVKREQEERGGWSRKAEELWFVVHLEYKVCILSVYETWTTGFKTAAHKTAYALEQ